MSRQVLCKKTNQMAAGLDHIPYPGELGQLIFDSISKPVWQEWLDHQTMLINEHRLNPLAESARDFIEIEMKKFFFGKGSSKPSGYTEKEKTD